MPMMIYLLEGEANFSTITTAITNALSTLQTNFFSMMGGILPTILAVIGAGVLVGLGIKWFKKVRG